MCVCVFVCIWYAYLIFVSRRKKYKNQVVKDVLGKTSELSPSPLCLRSTVIILPVVEIRDDWWSSLVVQRLGVRLPCRGCGFDPWFRKILRAVEQLSCVHNYWSLGPRVHPVAKSGPCCLQLGKVCAQQRKATCPKSHRQWAELGFEHELSESKVFAHNPLLFFISWVFNSTNKPLKGS